MNEQAFDFVFFADKWFGRQLDFQRGYYPQPVATYKLSNYGVICESGLNYI